MSDARRPIPPSPIPPSPDRLWIVRHGESAGNVAREAAQAADAHHIDIAERDADVPLSECGVAQARALGLWFGQQPAHERPDLVLASPYRRAVESAEAIGAAGGFAPETRIVVDERLREKEFGILDRLTRAGIEARHPEQAALRTELGKFYHRPPGGESWCDVILRLRSAHEAIARRYAGRRVLIVAHQVVVLCSRYILEDLDERGILAIDAAGDVANCGLTAYVRNEDGEAGSGLRLTHYNFVAPLETGEAPVTCEPNAAEPER